MSNTNDRDYINTQILDVDNTGLKITQDIVVSVAASYVVEESVKGAIYNLGGKQALKAATRRLDMKVTQKMMERIAKMANQKVIGTFTKQVSKLFSKTAAQVVLKSLGKAASSAAIKAGAATAGGCTLGPVGCAAGAAIGAAVFAAELAFTVFTTVQDIQDKKGMLNLFHRDYVDNIAKDFKDTLSGMYEELGSPGYMEEEVMFYPEFFMFEFEEDGTPYMSSDNEWALKFIEYQNEYLKSIGVEDGWEERVKIESIEPPDLSVNKITSNDKKKITVGIVIGGVIFFILLISCILLIVIL